ncbi:dihydrofolate reductase family protein [Pseudonocardia sp. N23]|uniref:dihydrofolate reductase family protein n=1 Tax=Pseudonocardia sp. N23 TaxID=1987376 RepID=UPI000BFC81A8|nr:dihydrofolate reductase family protein [Pseudonocardia sp. N23]GAY08380.1 dihydrofolate reductase [Pseudonocardia sp. N23]
MGAIKVHEFITLDGCIGAPMWTFEYPFTDEMMASLAAITGSASAILLGRTTWVEMGPAWSARSDADDPGVPFFNNSPKHVVSGSLTSSEGWDNSHLIGAYDVDTLRGLKADTDGDIYVSGSGTLVRAMLADGLVDELHLFVYPVALGTGPKLFPEGTENALNLLGCEAYTNQVVHLTYGPRSA